MLVSRAAPPLCIRLLGPFEVRLHGQPLRRLRTRKGEWLLALLTLRHHQPLERAWLAGTLWPDSDSKQSADNLRRALTDLRQALGSEAGCLRSPTAHALSLHLTEAEADLLAFDAAVVRGDVASLDQAVSLYRGPLLEGCYEEWLLLERQEREVAYLAALERLGEAALDRGEPDRAASYLRRAISVDPLRESAQRRLMAALAADGQHAAALGAYRELRARLQQEAAAEPDPETQVLFQQLRTQACQPLASTRAPSSPHPSPVSVLPHPGYLPRPLTPLIGRQQEVREITARLASGRLVTITGTGGVGKTRLAIQVAAERAAAYPDGVWFVDLAPLADPGLVPQAVAKRLQVPEEPHRSPVEILTGFLKGWQLLLVLDNCEHVAEGCAALATALLSECAELRVLATSRRALGITGELLWRAPSLSLPPLVADARPLADGKHQPASAGLSTHSSQLSTCIPSEAVRLFVERAAAVQPGFGLTEANAAAVVEICRRLDGIPLALELAAARARVLALDQIAARLDDRFGLLVSGSRAAPARQQTLQATLDWSYHLLSEKEQMLLRRLSVFAGGWTFEAAEAVCCDYKPGNVPKTAPSHTAQGGLEAQNSAADPPAIQNPKSKIQNADVLDLLSQLVDHSLVLYEAHGEEGRYRLLETVRQYGQERLIESGEAATVRARHLAYFVRLAEEGEPSLRGPEQVAWYQRLEREHDNMRAALTWAHASGAAPAGLRLAAAIGMLWSTHGFWAEGREWLTKLLALQGVPRLPPPVSVGASQAEGDSVGLQCRPAGVEPAGELILPDDPRRVRARALHTAGVLADRQRDTQVAQALTEECLALWRELDDEGGIAETLDFLGCLAYSRHDWGAARALVEESLAIRRRVGEKVGITNSLSNLARLASEEDNYAAARELRVEALALCRELGHHLGSSQQLFELGILALLDEDFAAARAFHAESLAIRRQCGDRWGIAWSLNSLADVARCQGDYAAAGAFWQESLALLQESGDHLCIAGVLQSLGYVAKAKGDYQRAAALFRESLIMHRELGEQRFVSICLGGLAGVIAAAGEPERGARLFGAVEALRESIGVHLWPGDRIDYERGLVATRAALGEAAFIAASASGRSLSWEEAIAEALRAR